MNKHYNGESRLLKLIFVLLVLILIMCSFVLLCFNFYLKKEKGEEEANNTGNVKVIKFNNFEFTYDFIDYPHTVDGKTLYTNKLSTIKITNDKASKIAKKITKDVNERIGILWNDIETNSPEFTDVDNLTEEELNEISNYGITLNIDVEKVTDYYLQIITEDDGSFGGSTWTTLSSFCYSTTTGKLLTLEDIVNEYDETYNYITNSMIDFIKNSSYYDDLIIDDWENEIKENLKNQWYFSDNGIVFYLQKYEIASGAAGRVEFTINYKDINSYLKNKYQE